MLVSRLLRSRPLNSLIYRFAVKKFNLPDLG